MQNSSKSDIVYSLAPTCEECNKILNKLSPDKHSEWFRIRFCCKKIYFICPLCNIKCRTSHLIGCIKDAEHYLLDPDLQVDKSYYYREKFINISKKYGFNCYDDYLLTKYYWKCDGCSQTYCYVTDE